MARTQACSTQYIVLRRIAGVLIKIHSIILGQNWLSPAHTQPFLWDTSSQSFFSSVMVAFVICSAGLLVALLRCLPSDIVDTHDVSDSGK